MYGDRSGYGSRSRSFGRSSGRSGPRGFGGDHIAPIREENEPVEFEKNFYIPSKTLSPAEAERLRQENNMRLVGSDIMPPVADFESLGFPEPVVRHFSSKGYSTPTPIQAQGWPMALSGRDMVGIADTGSGKTISFVLPALIHAKAQQPLRENDGPIVLILAPTRELCNQIEVVVAEYAGFFGLRSVAVYGGASIVPQKKAIVRGTEILVATPGRLIDLHDQGFCPLSRVSFLVLDEADRMLDMGFEPQLQRIIPKTNPKRQTLMWSATWPREVRRLANDYLREFIQVTIGDDSLKANKKIVQKIEMRDSSQKMPRLLELVREYNGSKVIIFANTKHKCDEIERVIYREHIEAAALHGDKSQGARDEVIRAFKNGRCNVLVATDVAARGLDISDVRLVINFDFPNCIDDYVHRIGRTARGSAAEGLAITFFGNADQGSARGLVKVMEQADQKPPAELVAMAQRGGGGGGSSRFGRRGSYGGHGGYGGQSRSFSEGARSKRFGY